MDIPHGWQVWALGSRPSGARLAPGTQATSAELQDQFQQELAEAQRLAGIGSWRWDFDTGAMYWSPMLFHIFGVDPAAPQPQFFDYLGLFDPRGEALLSAGLAAAVRDGIPYAIELEVRPPTGAPHRITARGEAVRDSAGQIVALRGTVQDITELRRIESALQDSEQRFRAIFDSLFQLAGVLKPDGTLVEVNRTALEFGGVHAAEVLGKPVWDTHWWNARPEIQQQLKDAVARAASGEFIRYDVQIRGRDGALITIDFSLNPISGADGRVRLIIAEGRNVTEERQARAALAESESRFRLAMRNAPIGIALIDLDGRLIEVNGALCTMLGRTEQALLRRQLSDYADDSAGLRCDLREVQPLLGGTAERLQLFKRYRRADGAGIVAQLDLSLLRSVGGRPLHFIAQVQDVTERQQLEEAQKVLTQRLTLALKVSGIGVWDWDLTSNAIEADESIMRLYGIAPGKLISYDVWRQAVVAEDLPATEATLHAAIAECKTATMSFRIRHRQHGIRYIEAGVGIIPDKAGKAGRLVAVNLDVTARREAEQRTLESRALLRNLIDNLPMWISMIDRDGRYVVTNQRHAQTLGLDIAQIEGHHYREVLSGTAFGDTATAWERAMRGETVASGHRLHEDGRIMQLHGIHLPISAGPQAGYSLGVFSDVTALKQAEAQLSEANRKLEQRITEVLKLQELLHDQATRDGLTGLYNRRYFDEMLERELARARREGYDLSLIIADLDNFKALNDRFGHQAGDAVLCAWSELLRQGMRSSDVLCRYGGEEFAIVLPHCSLAMAIERAEALRTQFEALNLSTDPHGPRIGTTVSLGIAQAVAGCRNASDLIQSADAALYRAKRLGRNHVEYEVATANLF